MTDATDRHQEAELRQNLLLANLPPGELSRLSTYVEVVGIELRHQVYEPRQPISHLYFPLSSVFSMVALADGRISVEVGTIGYEGIVGLPLFLGSVTSPNAAFCQVAGRAARIDAAGFRDFLAQDGALHGELHRYTQTTMVQLAQNVVCNSTHNTEQRAARWLLTTGDRVRRDEFPMTQEFLGQMLGVRRPTVSETAGHLQERGLIRYSRGHMTITDREALTTTACSCYALLADEFRRVQPSP